MNGIDASREGIPDFGFAVQTEAKRQPSAFRLGVKKKVDLQVTHFLVGVKDLFFRSDHIPGDGLGKGCRNLGFLFGHKNRNPSLLAVVPGHLGHRPPGFNSEYVPDQRPNVRIPAAMFRRGIGQLTESHHRSPAVVEGLHFFQGRGANGGKGRQHDGTKLQACDFKFVVLNGGLLDGLVIDEIQIDPVVVDGFGQFHQGLSRLIGRRLKSRPQVVVSQRA